MKTPTPISATVPSRTLRLERTLRAPRAAVWRCWTEPELLQQWFCPVPWRVTAVAMEVRAGGRFDTTMQGPGPDGEMSTQENNGVFLEVVPGTRLVTTDAFGVGWIPCGHGAPAGAERAPFMVAQVDLTDAPEGHTHYVAEARHWSRATTVQHEQMGFHEGWGAAADQLEALARRVAGL